MLQLYVGVSEQIKRFRKDLSGATAIEYGLIAGLIGVVIIGALVVLGPELSTLFNKITTELKGAGGT